MKKEIILATAITGLLTSLSAGDEPTKVDIKKISISKDGKIIAPLDIKKIPNASIEIKKMDKLAGNGKCGIIVLSPTRA